MVTKYSDTIMPFTQGLLDDSVFDLHRFVRGSFLYASAELDGRIAYRGGGWYRLDGRQFRGRHQVRDELIRLADEDKG